MYSPMASGCARSTQVRKRGQQDEHAVLGLQQEVSAKYTVSDVVDISPQCSTPTTSAIRCCPLGGLDVFAVIRCSQVWLAVEFSLLQRQSGKDVSWWNVQLDHRLDLFADSVRACCGICSKLINECLLLCHVTLCFSLLRWRRRGVFPTHAIAIRRAIFGIGRD